MGTEESPFTRRDLLLYMITVCSWSASWYVLKVNSGYSVSPPVSTCWRFALAALVMFAYVSYRGERLRFGLRTHGWFVLLGVFLFSSSFIMFYYASMVLVSGLLAVVFSLASIFNLAIGIMRGDMAGPRRWFGAALGVAGIILLYWPSLRSGGSAGIGLLLCLGGTLCFCIGNQVGDAMKRLDVPLLSATAWGMAYGALWSAIISASAGFPFIYDPAIGYTLSLLFLALVSTVLAFWAYLNLLRSIGAARASYATVMFPVFALMLSSVLEDYSWTPMAFAGVLIALTGNLFVLSSAKRRGVRVPTPVV